MTVFVAAPAVAAEGKYSAEINYGLEPNGVAGVQGEGNNPYVGLGLIAVISSLSRPKFLIEYIYVIVAFVDYSSPNEPELPRFFYCSNN